MLVPTNPSDASENSNSLVEISCKVFAAADLEALARTEYSPISTVIKTLIGIVQEAPEYSTDNPLYGRFALSSYADSAFDHRLVFRQARQALDFLEADYLACEQSDLDFWRLQVNKIDAMRTGSPLEQTNPITTS